MSAPRQLYDQPEDLSARARREHLSEFEQRELKRALENDAELRLVHAVGCELDRAARVQTGDEQLILRAADVALVLAGRAASDAASGNGARSGARDSGLALRALQVLALGTVVLLSSWGLRIGMRAETHAPAPKTAARSVPQRTASAPTENAGSQLETPSQATEQHAMEPQVRNAGSVEPRVAGARNARRSALGAARGTAAQPTSAKSPETTAAELFHRANAARRRGEFPMAKAQYSELIARFPESAEARLARLSLGRLLLATGDSADAERTLRGYLADGDRALGEEALVSRAQSLRALGRTVEEQQAWQLLLSRYPSTIYAAPARQRLSALASQGAVPDP